MKWKTHRNGDHSSKGGTYRIENKGTHYDVYCNGSLMARSNNVTELKRDCHQHLMQMMEVLKREGYMKGDQNGKADV